MTTARDYHLVLPPAWVRIPLDDRAGERIVLVAAQQTASVDPRQREAARTSMVRLLQHAVRDAQDHGGTDVLLSVGSVGRVPISASCLVSYFPSEGIGLETLAEQLRGEGDLVEVVQVAGAPAIRRRAEREVPFDAHKAVDLAEQLGLPAEQLAVPVVHDLSFYVPLPGTQDLLAFSFTATQPELAEALLELFDAVMSTMRWVA